MKTKNPYASIIIISFLLTAFIASGCSVGQEFTDFADSAGENYLIAINNKDYREFSENLNADMKNALPEAAFYEFADQMKEIIGNYIPGTKEMISTRKQNGYNTVSYIADYTKEEAGKVIVKIVLQKSGEIIMIAGSWFDSPKLRKE